MIGLKRNQHHLIGIYGRRVWNCWHQKMSCSPTLRNWDTGLRNHHTRNGNGTTPHCDNYIKLPDLALTFLKCPWPPTQASTTGWGQQATLCQVTSTMQQWRCLVVEMGKVSLQGWAGWIDSPAPLNSITKLIESWLVALAHYQSQEEQHFTSGSFVKGKGLAIADGSCMSLRNDKLRAAAWYLQHSDSCIGYNGVVQTSGDEYEVNAYHSKLPGLHSAFMAILAICKFCNVSEGWVTVCCNNKHVLWLSGISSQQVSSKSEHADLIWAIRKIITEIPIEVELKEVKGHLDKHYTFLNLDRPSQLHV